MSLTTEFERLANTLEKPSNMISRTHFEKQMLQTIIPVLICFDKKKN